MDPAPELLIIQRYRRVIDQAFDETVFPTTAQGPRAGLYHTRRSQPGMTISVDVRIPESTKARMRLLILATIAGTPPWQEEHHQIDVPHDLLNRSCACARITFSILW
jgi:hypothetical protein